MKPAPAQSHTEKKHNWTTATVLGLILSVLGLVGLIELRPQIEVSPLEELRKEDSFSAPFRIHNAGYLSIHIQQVVCTDSEVKIGILVSRNNIYIYGPASDTWLRRGESETIFCTISKARMRPSSADISIHIFYRAWIVPYTLHNSSRFVGAYGDRWDWLQQPSTR